MSASSSELPAPAAPPRASWRRWLAALTLALAVLAGPAYPVYVHYDFSHSRDTLTYLSLARGDYAGTSVTRRYRVLVPWTAAAVAWPMQRAYARLWPNRAQADWPLRLAFYLLNTLLMAAAGALLWRTAERYGATPLAAALATAVALTSRWAVYTAGLPLVDSLYCLVFALALYGVKARARWALVACLLLGPLAKESFVFLVPWLLWFGRPTLSLPRQLALLAVAAAAVVGVHHWVDARAGAAPTESVSNAFAHLDNILYSLRRLFSLKGIGEAFSIFGFGWLLLLPALRGAGGGWARLDSAARWLPVVVAVHMLLSGDLGRMGYLAAPTFVVALALALTLHPAYRWLRGGAPEGAAS